MADRYVNYDKLLEERHRLGLDEMSKIHKVNAFNQFIDELPKAEVEEVRHGEWKHECLECSVCKRNISEICDADSYLTSGIEFELLFCPHCGARMDGKKVTG